MTSSPPAGSTLRFARVTNPLITALAGRRFSPWAVMHHRGRKSGRDLAVPVVVIATPDSFVINLPWGARTNWVRNVLAAGECTISWRGRTHRADTPRVLDEATARPYYSKATWWIARHLFPADAWLLLRRQGM
ncbi:nitroreductase family deazaflavin-dependent oxidoreductase [Actinoplanes bogorensis]|uniref:Nitroreductase family deazaflavin-dependent oxidoreductase n=1 Tax=Paractinoplanes bogorensis TaxID=1610840 RepID=A0ABS5Z4S7_9ACTN|nr:nitroreductase family deazaflavin-dependent oxidoreductase [Actinoplanes bogorensis]MBU2670386.1 nitroreductase family deazaflavin-dependent oxidoreductase [Actinoplanes bogorensis]